jgi:hypothetical protein
MLIFWRLLATGFRGQAKPQRREDISSHLSRGRRDGRSGDFMGLID